MTKWSPNFAASNLWPDFLASIVVFLTALPLCMGIALASGAPVEAGLLTGIIGGLLIGFLSGSSFQVSGPAAGLSVLVFELIQSHGWQSLGIVLVVAGLIQLIAGQLKLAQLFRAVSPAVVNGMLSGIGMMIAAGQIYVMCDLSPKASGLKNIAGVAQLWHSICTDAHVLTAGALGLATIAIIFGWKRFAPKKLQCLPGPLVAIVAVSAYAAINHLPLHYVTVPSNFSTAIHLLNLQSAQSLGTWEIARNALALALIASAETLLSANAVDRLHNSKRTDYDRELKAQGIGNLLCGLLGGLPMTGVIARSSVNVHAGARSRASAIFHGLWLLLFVSSLPWLLRMVPVASLAALLVVTGCKLIDMQAIKKLWSYGPRLVAIYAATVIAIVCTDLLTGVMVGVVMSFAKLLYTMSRLDIKTRKFDGGKRVSFDLHGAATFVALPKLAAALESVPNDCELHVSLEHLDYVDHACLELLVDWERQHESSGGSLVIDWGELHAAFKFKSGRRRIQAQAQQQAVTNAVRKLPRRLVPASAERLSG